MSINVVSVRNGLSLVKLVYLIYVDWLKYTRDNFSSSH